MTDKPILFSGPMIRAILDGRKTQTRRLIKGMKAQFEHPEMGGWQATTFGGDGVFQFKGGKKVPVPETIGIWHQTSSASIASPFQIGDRLWVRETWGINDYRYCRPNPIPKVRPDDLGSEAMVYFASESDAEILAEMPRTPSLFMPRWASRLTLTITDIRAQRLQGISQEDAEAEGCPDTTGQSGEPRGWFEQIWGEINGPDAWVKNPWVWALTFTVEKRNIDAELVS